MAQQSSEPHASQQLFELLKKDHRDAEQVMNQMESASPQKREELMIGLQDMLMQHMILEEKEFYPQLQKIEEMADMVQDALEEHQEAKDYLEELVDMEASDEDWLSTFQDLQEGIKHHVEDEEKEIFPECRKHLSEQQFTQMFQKCSQIKEQAASGAKAKSQQRQKQATA